MRVVVMAEMVVLDVCKPSKTHLGFHALLL